ncbi:MAG: AMP-binding protein [Actinomycetota bacterium]
MADLHADGDTSGDNRRNEPTADRTAETGANLAAYLHRDETAPAIVTGRTTITHAELAERVSRWRGGLVAAGVRAGDRVALVGGNSIDFVVAHLAALGIGAVSAPLNPQTPTAELARELAVIDPFAAIGAPDTHEHLTAGAALTPQTAMQILTAEELDGGEPSPMVHVTPDQPAVLLFTSGTAGPSKPAILTHGNLLSALQAMLSLPLDLVGGAHTFLGVIPLFQVFGLNTVLHLSLVSGGRLLLSEFDGPGRTLSLIRTEEATVVAGPPTLWRALVGHPEAGSDDLRSVRLAVSGAAKLPTALKSETEARFGIELDEGYGLTESSAVVASTLTTDAPLGSIGRLLPGVSARIVDPLGADCPIGDPGELLVRGPMVFPGYWGGAVGVDPFTEDGWLRTGDIALVDEDGYLAIVDRSKDLIIVSGFNVFPAEVEGVIAAHPDVADVGVVGEPSERTGEAVAAFVVPRGDVTLTEDELRRHCEAELARYKVPSRFVIAPDLPIGPTGKLQRIRLR